MQAFFITVRSDVCKEHELRIVGASKELGSWKPADGIVLRYIDVLGVYAGYVEAHSGESSLLFC